MILHFVDATLSQNSFYLISYAALIFIFGFFEEIIVIEIDGRFIEKLSLSKKMTYRPPLATDGLGLVNR